MIPVNSFQEKSGFDPNTGWVCAHCRDMIGYEAAKLGMQSTIIILISISSLSLFCPPEPFFFTFHFSHNPGCCAILASPHHHCRPLSTVNTATYLGAHAFISSFPFLVIRILSYLQHLPSRHLLLCKASNCHI